MQFIYSGKKPLDMRVKYPNGQVFAYQILPSGVVQNTSDELLYAFMFSAENKDRKFFSKPGEVVEPKPVKRGGKK